jgi:integrase
MVSISYSLNKPKQKISPIMMIIYYKGNRVFVSTQISIPTESWNSKKQNIKNSFRYGRQINDYLESLKKSVTDWVYNELAKGSFPEKAKTKNFVTELVNPEKKNREDIFSIYEKYILDGQTTGKFRPSTIVTKRSTLTKLQEFQKDTGFEVSFESIGEQFYIEFVHYFSDVKKRANPYVTKLLSELKTFLRWALKHNYHTNREGIDHLDSLGKKYKNHIALSMAEVTQIQNMDFDEIDFTGKNSLRVKLIKENLERTRDRFLFQIYTGLRVSDLSNLRPEFIDKENNILDLRDIKTDGNVYIPLHRRLKTILDKYPGFSFPDISDQKYNENIKELCKYCGINEKVVLTHYIKKERIDKTFKKYEIITSHTARRTYITMIKALGIDSRLGMVTTGHTRIETFEGYNKMDKIKAAQEVGKLLDEM